MTAGYGVKTPIEKRHLAMSFFINRQRATFPGLEDPSIIAEDELNFCVRDGNRCYIVSIATRTESITEVTLSVLETNESFQSNE